MFSSSRPINFSGNGQELGGCYLTLFLILNSGLLVFFILALCDLFIKIRIDVGIGSASVLSFGNFCSYNNWDPCIFCL